VAEEQQQSGTAQRLRRALALPVELTTLRNQLDVQVAHLHKRIDDETAGTRQAVFESLRDELDRIDAVVTRIGGLVDQASAAAAEATQAADLVEVRLAEAAELAAQPRAAARLEARRIAELEARLAELEARLGAEGRSSAP